MTQMQLSNSGGRGGFLLFTIGLEFSLSRLRHIFRQVALGGLLQVSVTTIVTIAIAIGLAALYPKP